MSNSFIVRTEAAFYGSNWAGSCFAGHRIPSKLFGTLFENTNVHYARWWTVGLWISHLFGHYRKYAGLVNTKFESYFLTFFFFQNSLYQTKAAARHQCTYLVNLYKKEFLEQRGDPNWLKGLDYIPPKLRAIYDINKILAHRP